MPHPVLTTRALKCTVLLDPGEVEALVLVEGMPRVQLNVRTADGSRTVIADIAAKAVRKAQAVIAEHGTDGVAACYRENSAWATCCSRPGWCARLKSRGRPRWRQQRERATDAR